MKWVRVDWPLAFVIRALQIPDLPGPLREHVNLFVAEDGLERLKYPTSLQDYIPWALEAFLRP